MSMKRKHTMFLWMLIIVFMATMIPPIEYVAADDGDYVWEKNYDGGATITGYNGDETEVVIPDELGGLIVTRIGDSAFFGNRLTQIVIPNSVIRIDQHAFYNNNLTEIVIPDGVEFIGYGAFGDNQLTEVVIPDSVTSIGISAFNSNQLTKVIISDSISSIGTTVFANNQLTEIIIPDSVTSIGHGAFYNNRLTEVDIPDSVTNIGPSVFASNQLTEIVIPKSVTSIGDRAFWDNQLTEAIIPDSVTDIGSTAFENNQSDSADLTIYGYEDSAAETYAKDKGHTFINMIMLIYEWEKNDDGGATITGYNGDETEIVIPDELGGLTVTEIQDQGISNGVFEDKGITSITLPENLKHIGNSAFANNQLTKIVIPNSVTSIGSLAFKGNQLTEVIISDSVMRIGIGAFRGNQLTKIVIPESVTSIGNNAFSSNQLTEVDIPDSVISIEYSAFANNQLTEVVIPDSVTSVGTSAFNGNQLTEVIIPDSVSSIGNGVFANNQLTKVVIPDSVTSIGSDAFNDNQLTEVVIPDNVTSIGWSAFRNNNLSEVIIPNSVTSIGVNAFADNQIDPVDLTIYGYENSEAESHATTNVYQFKALDSPPDIDIHLDSVPIDNLLSEEGVLSLGFGSKGELNAVYSHGLKDVDIVQLKVIVSWEIEGASKSVEGDTLELETYTNKIGERKIILTVETNYGGKGTKELILGVESRRGGGGHIPSSDATLKKLEILEDNTNRMDFYPNQFEYKLETEAEEVELVFESSHSRARVKVNDKIVEEKTSLRLEEGENGYEIIVIAENGKEQKYIVTIHRLQAVPFSDIEGHWAEEYIKKAYRNDWLKGYLDGSFDPEKPVTRMQAASLFVRILGLTERSAVSFNDIHSVEDETVEELEKAYASGIVNGFPDQTFKPYQNVTRAQLALMIYRSYEKMTGTVYEPEQPADFPDIVGYDDETKNAIAMLVELGIAEGSEGKFLPHHPATRAHAAKMLVNYHEVLTSFLETE